MEPFIRIRITELLKLIHNQTIIVTKVEAVKLPFDCESSKDVSCQLINRQTNKQTNKQTNQENYAHTTRLMESG